MNWDWDKLSEKRQRQGGGSQPPDLGDFGESFKKFKEFKVPGGAKILVVLVILAIIGYSMFYIVKPGEVGVVQRFGAFNRMTGNGPHLKFPYPIEKVQTPIVEKPQRIEVGFRTTTRREDFSQNTYRLIPEESLMLTGDENMVDVQFIVQYQIKDAKNYLFNIKNPEEVVMDAAEAAMREVVGSNKIDAVLTEKKLDVQTDMQALLQEILDRYNSGIRVVTVKLQDVHAPKEVIDAFKDVQNAKEDKNRYIHEAEAYRNDLIPKTRGEVASILNEAKGYKESIVRKAKGETSRFLALYKEYLGGKQVTRTRLYLETMEEILSSPGLEKVIFTDKALQRTVPYLPLDNVRRKAPRNPGAGKTGQGN